MEKVVWRFNLKEGVDEAQFFKWLKEHVWASSEKYGCQTKAFKLHHDKYQYSTEALWPSGENRKEWAQSEEFESIPNYPGFDSPWGAQEDLEMTIYKELEV